MRISYRIFKVSYLSSSYEKLFNPKKFNQLEPHSKLITHARIKENYTEDEQYLTFFTHKNNRIDLTLNKNILSILYITETQYVTIDEINVYYLRYVVRDKSIMIRYFIEYEKKIQLNFFSLEELDDFRSNLGRVMKGSYLDIIEKMNFLSGIIKKPEKCDLDANTLMKAFVDLVSNHKLNK